MRTLDHSPADIIRHLLIAKLLGSYPVTPPGVWPVYVSFEPDAPDNVITLFNTTGHSGGRVMIGGELQDHYGFQVRIRAVDDPTAYIKGNRIRAVMSEDVRMTEITIESSRYLIHAVSNIGNLIGLGRETVKFGMDPSSTKRSIFVLNARASIRQLTS